MKTVKALLDALETIAPSRGMEEWDNGGLLLGSSQWPLERVGVALDPSEDVIEEAARRGCSAVVTHHPMTLTGWKTLSLETAGGRLVARALERSVALVAAHTNWDRALEGMNVALGRALPVSHMHPLLPAKDEGLWGDGGWGELPSPLPVRDLAREVGQRWGVSWGQLFAPDPAAVASRIAWVGGAGGSFWRVARERGASLFCTADMKYHERRDAVEAGLALLVLDHGEMERFSLASLARLLQHRLEEDVEVLVEAPRFDQTLLF